MMETNRFSWKTKFKVVGAKERLWFVVVALSGCCHVKLPD
jgi:hypothetical protein